ncbi:MULTISPECIES: ATP nucleotide 3'-pyrophosphokinase [Streptomyces]|uniref:ATP nucleotide 3'-pyrophosphokinase n=1 Tax=Streptomyces alboflavus TaxID=67267 RepID=A0A1Z1W2W7_9ACTN|nr:ATP nucleotide 3'-pyrophosphokinase [Streptomyces alboflavus]ARX80760.1 ATP nucleotide 3'-pyrophosphokinase [Streptomyces alboflavus]
MTSRHHLGRSAAVLTAALAFTTATTALTATAADSAHKTGKHTTATAAAPRAGAGSAQDVPDGGWEGDGLRLSAEENRKVDAYVARARQAEPAITRDVRAAAHLGGADLIGLEHRLKSPDSLKRKVATDLKEYPENTVDQALARLNDAVRYTLRWPDGEYVTGATIASQVLSAWGNDTTKWSNTWGRAQGYKGLNSGWRAPDSRQRFEVQFHTPASKYAQEETHKLYEEQRLPTTSPERKKELQAQQNALFAAVPVPDGAPELTAPAPAQAPVPALTPVA